MSEEIQFDDPAITFFFYEDDEIYSQIQDIANEENMSIEDAFMYVVKLGIQEYNC